MNNSQSIVEPVQPAQPTPAPQSASPVNPNKGPVTNKRRLITICALVAAVILVIGGIAWYMIANNNSDEGSNDGVDTTAEGYIPDGTVSDEELESDPDSPSVKATAAYESGGLSALVVSYQESIDSAPDDQRRAEIMLERANALIGYYYENQDDAYREQALADYLESERLSPSAASASSLSSYYYYIDDKDNGDKYWGLALERDPSLGS